MAARPTGAQAEVAVHAFEDKDVTGSSDDEATVVKAEDVLDDLSDEQIAEFKEAFAMFDRNGDGCITTGELGFVMRRMGQDPSEEELEKLIAEIDVDGDGTVDFAEFLTMMVKKMHTDDSEDDLIEAFYQFDPDQKGTITTRQLISIMDGLGEDITPEEMLEIVSDAETDGEGLVDYRAFTKQMLLLAP